MTLRWIAPGDDCDRGTAAQYKIRYALTNYTGDGWWDTLSIPVDYPAQPRVAGTAESLIVNALISESTYYFALKAADEAGNWSNISNIAAVVPTFPPPPPNTIVVPAGTFTMGDGGAFCGRDEREVTLTRDFFLGQYEVTNQEYMEAVQWAYDHGYVTATSISVRDNFGYPWILLSMGSDVCEIGFNEEGRFYLREAPQCYEYGAYPEGYDPADHPVMVTWHGAAAYCDWISLMVGLPPAYEHGERWSCNGGDPYGAQGYRLPTDAEWEYAAQWDDERKYPWGNEEPDCSITNFRPVSDICIGWTAPVGSYPDAPEALGLSDLAGNVWEWCNDWHLCDLGTSPETDPPGPGGPGGPGWDGWRVLRGGAWTTHAIECSRRSGWVENDFWYMGFRIAKTISP